MRPFLIQGILLAAALAALIAARSRLEDLGVSKMRDAAQLQESLYLPNPRAVTFISFGYKNALAQLLWFKTISYFGKHYRGDGNYRWFNHMCDLVTTLNPKAKHYYQFCSAMLAWEASLPQQAAQILTKGISNNPEDWYLIYQRGFIHIFFLNDEGSAKEDFVRAAKMPDAHPIVATLASKKILSMDSPEQAIEFLTQMINSTSDPSAQSVYRDRIRDAEYEIGFRILEEALRRFEERNGKKAANLEELASEGLVPDQMARDRFRDPFGGQYILDPAGSKLSSSSGKRRPALYWKLAEENSNSD
ncbi:MAG: hypothetical protein DCC75_07255 [Proteobacteria bacterium]|nr:MAG: hypothetical protein DCC75_07255 [Pseudomonadota bacterium]